MLGKMFVLSFSTMTTHFLYDIAYANTSDEIVLGDVLSEDGELIPVNT